MLKYCKAKGYSAFCICKILSCLLVDLDQGSGGGVRDTELKLGIQLYLHQ
jgi:hypothetical protein